ncbi:MAG: hypothetical protein GF313_06540 [Caldithrix sp.]|nr:hypothetical protein [Caldithrix sp.]
MGDVKFAAMACFFPGYRFILLALYRGFVLNHGFEIIIHGHKDTKAQSCAKTGTWEKRGNKAQKMY